jgi:murein DD-endopeptidase MepM/ murein hydrolase activator NlpD
LEEKKTLSSRLSTKYLLIIRNEDNFAEKTTYNFSYTKILLAITLIFIALFGISFYLSTSLLKEWFDPRHAELQANKEVIALSMAVDSLQNEVGLKDKFINNLKMILSGEDDSYVDIENNPNIVNSDVNSNNVSVKSLNPIDSLFRKEFEKDGQKLQLRTNAEFAEGLQDFYLFKPVEGIITEKFNPKTSHFAIDIVSKEDEPIKVVADGTVIFSSWTQDSGYVIGVQHRGNLISIYKHNSDLLKNVGNFVTAGEVISIIGNTGELTSGPHLHFELWFNGNPIDPEDFMKF